MNRGLDLRPKEAVERTAREAEHLREHADALGPEVALHVGDRGILDALLLGLADLAVGGRCLDLGDNSLLQLCRAHRYAELRGARSDFSRLSCVVLLRIIMTGCAVL
jgi:hypothetical protein